MKHNTVSKFFNINELYICLHKLNIYHAVN